MVITAIDKVHSMPQTEGIDDKEKQARIIRLKKACQQFESLFLYYMLKTMRSASSKSSLFGDGLGSDMYMQMFDEGMADKMAESSPLGISNMLFKSYADNISDDNNEKLLDQLDKSAVYKPNIKTRIKTNQVPKQDNELGLISKTIIQAANFNKIDPKLVTAVMMQESGGNPNAVSPKGAKGLMQLMDPTAKMLGVKDSFDIKQNIFGGVKYLASLLQKFNGDVRKTLAAYNAGPEAVKKYNGIPPYEETEKYVSSIMANLKGLMNFQKSR